MYLNTSQKLLGNIFCEHGNWVLMPKAVFPWDTWIVAASNLPEKYTCSLFSSLLQQLWWSIWVFWEKQASCHFLARSTFSSSQGHYRYGSQHSQNTLPWHLFSWNGTRCPKCVFTNLWNCREICLLVGLFVFKPENLAWCQKQYFQHMKARKLKSHTCQINTLVRFFLNYNNSLSDIWLF